MENYWFRLSIQYNDNRKHTSPVTGQSYTTYNIDHPVSGQNRKIAVAANDLFA